MYAVLCAVSPCRRHSADGHTHSLALDGVSPGAALLYDSDGGSGGTLYTPGIGQTAGGPGGARLFTNVDALGSVHDTETDGSGGPPDARRYDAFGLPVVSQGGDPLPLGFAGAAGYQTDSDTGLMLLGNRYYDASVGRFITPDKAKAGYNWYAYCGNDPLTQTDPTGLFATGMTAPTGASFGNPIAQANAAVGAINALFSWGRQAMARMTIARANITGYGTLKGRIVDDLDFIAMSPIGQSLLDSPKFDSASLNINYFHDANPNDGDLYANSFYSGAGIASLGFAPDTIQFDPSLHLQVDTPYGRDDDPSVVILEHELGHDATAGPGLRNGLPDDDNQGSNGGPNITNNEDPFRQWLGLPPRTSHGGYNPQFHL